MANVLSKSFSKTYAGDFVQELFYAPQEAGQNVFAEYRVMSDVINDKTLYIPGTLTKVLKSASGCGFSASGQLTITDRTLSVCDMKIELEQCFTEFQSEFHEQFLKQGSSAGDVTGTIVQQMVEQKARDAFNSDVPRVAWFADADDADADWTQCDGWISTAVDTSANLSQVLDMDSTAFETGDALATDGAAGLLKNMWENRSKVLRNAPNQRIYVTCTVYDNLLDTYEDTQSSAGLLRLVDGVNQLTYRGIPIVIVEGWDTALADTTNPHYTGNGLSIGSNLIVWTVPENLLLGTNLVTPGSDMDVWYEKKDEKVYWRIRFKMGVEILHPSLMSIAY